MSRQLNVDARKVTRTDDQIGVTSGVATGVAGLFTVGVIAWLLNRNLRIRKQAENALRHAEENLRDFVDNATVGLHWVGPDGIILWANRAELELLGYTEEEYIGHHIAEFHADPPVIEDILQRLTRRETLHDSEARLRCKDGSIREVLINSNVLWDGDTFIHTRCFTRDITERKRAEQAHAFLATLVESSEDAILSKDMDGTIATWNRGAERLFGYSAQEAIGQPVTMLLPPDKLDEEIRILACVRSGKRVKPYETVRRRKDGTMFNVSLSVSPIVDARGEIVGASKIARDITVRKQAETSLRESEERFRATFASAPVGIAHVGLDGRWLSFNDAVCTITGYEREKLATLTFADITHPDDVEADWAKARRLLAGEFDLYSIEKRYIRADGVFVWVNLTVSLLRDAAGAPVNFISVMEDIAERKQGEDALRESQQFTRRVLDSLYAFVGVLTVDGTLIEANRAPLEAAGISTSEVLGKKFWDCYWWSYSPEIQAKLRDACGRAAEGEIVRYDVPVRMVGETATWIDFQIGPLRDAEGTITHLIPSGMDITARRAAAEKLRESEERFRVMTDNIAQLAWMADAEGALFWYNQRWFDYTGTTLEEMQGWGWEKIHHPDHLPRMLPKWKAALERGQPWEDTFPLRGMDGEYRWFLSRASPIRDSDGKIVRWFGTNTDIHDERRAMEELARASRAKDNFLAALSHELRTPLNPVLMTATSLANDPALPAAARVQLEMMRRNIELEARLIDDLLDLTRISHGKLIIAPVTTDIHELLHHTDEIIRSDGLGKRIQVVLKLDAARHHALADPVRVQQVFWNLLRNAVKFTPDGGTITVSTRNDVEGRIIISVADTGIGIRAGVLAQIFNAFEQGDTSGEHRYGGLGLGLAISSAIVTAHGGQIRADSEGRGHGAEFSVTLGTVPAPAISSENKSPQAPPALSLSLLIVEDHEASRMVLEHFLTRSAHQVTTAATVHDALAAYKAAHFDVVISDLGLPDGSGIDLMVQIQNIRPVPAIALSGYGMEGDLQRTRDAGFSAHLVKPVKMDQLKQLLAQMAAHAG